MLLKLLIATTYYLISIEVSIDSRPCLSKYEHCLACEQDLKLIAVTAQCCHIYLHIYIHIYIDKYLHTYILTFVHTCIHIYKNM